MSAASTTQSGLYIETAFGSSEPAGATSGSPITRTINGVKKWFWPTSSQALQVARASNPGAINLTGRTPTNSLVADVIGGVLFAEVGGLFGPIGESSAITGEATADTATTEAEATPKEESSGGGTSGGTGLLKDAGQLGLAVALEQWVTGNVGKALTYVALFLVGVGLIGYGARGLAAGRSQHA